MSGKKILALGFNVTIDEVKNVKFDSRISLSDWDIITIFPDISDYYKLADDSFKDKPALSKSYYQQIKDLADHWRKEILEAFNSNKTIIIILNELQEIYVDSGEKKYSETDHQKKVTRLFEIFKNYDVIPLKLNPLVVCGKSMKLTRDGAIIAEYWKNFSSLSEYKIIIEEKLSGSLLLTDDENIAGAYAQNKSTKGTIILIPFLNFSADISFGKKFIESIIEIDKALNPFPVHDNDDSNPAQKRSLKDEISVPSPEHDLMPDWLDDPIFDLPRITKLKEEILRIDTQIVDLGQQIEHIKLEIINEGRYKRLLYEKGTALEKIVENSLALMGFKISKSEQGFDIVFQSEEGRFFGEVAGQDDEAIGFDKLRQLEMRILEDYAHEESEELAKGILFGNAYSLQELNSRSNFFTTKCMAAAKKNRIALVRTPDLFWIVKYLSNSKDEKYAKKCREAILRSEGEIVKFPGLP